MAGSLVTSGPCDPEPAVAFEQAQESRTYTADGWFDSFIGALSDQPNRGSIRHNQQPPARQFCLVRCFLTIRVMRDLAAVVRYTHHVKLTEQLQEIAENCCNI